MSNPTLFIVTYDSRLCRVRGGSLLRFALDGAGGMARRLLHNDDGDDEDRANTGSTSLSMGREALIRRRRGVSCTKTGTGVLRRDGWGGGAGVGVGVVVVAGVNVDVSKAVKLAASVLQWRADAGDHVL